MPALRTRLEPSPAAPSRGLVDRFGRRATDLRISLTDKCNLRCTYCMPAAGMQWLPQPDLLTAAEIHRLVRVGVEQLGVRELRLTGGEPLIRPDLEEIVRGVRRQHPGLPISITTNAIGLDRRARGLKDAGLSRVNVSLDSLDPETFRHLARRDRLGDVIEGIEGAVAAGLGPVKLNAVLMRGINDAEAPGLLTWALERGLSLRFIEQMPLDADHGWTRDGMVTAQEIREMLSTRFTLSPHPAERDGAPAELWDVRAGPGTPSGRGLSGSDDRPLGTVGIIASVTEPFCGDCKRTRITAEGEVRSCLFSHEEFGLRDLLRDPLETGESETDRDHRIADRWRAAMWIKPAAHGMDHAGLDSTDFVQPERSMSAIGG
ncbi:GTP 3',8-cyclase MoaA [Kocuria coralli]|uniref:GTP 3',8-cyclase n=1 Tax=Kocuria coralli TaxID=1461025 RepID=A0A5J5KX38_9MICC|nr:GTP 3',8-cyclase MoaA [Kocuria coralli]KAA9394243.1 GTP 3',8-cyclase MoaA [Kocuria coralli]